jgi:DNA topoisomerase-3
MARHDFEEVLGGMARAGLLRIAEATFEKDGKAIPYCRVTLTQAGYSVDQSMPVAFVMKNTSTASTRRRPQGKTTAPKNQGKTTAPKNRKRRRAGVPEMPATANSPRRATPSEGEPGAPFPAEAMLRAWRLAESRRRGVPAFRIFTDKALQAMAAARPSGTQGLLTISGLGIRTVEQYGVEICRILSGRSD